MDDEGDDTVLMDTKRQEDDQREERIELQLQLMIQRVFDVEADEGNTDHLENKGKDDVHCRLLDSAEQCLEDQNKNQQQYLQDKGTWER